jgi:hypothetical protein
LNDLIGPKIKVKSDPVWNFIKAAYEIIPDQALVKSFQDIEYNGLLKTSKSKTQAWIKYVLNKRLPIHFFQIFSNSEELINGLFTPASFFGGSPDILEELLLILSALVRMEFALSFPGFQMMESNNEATIGEYVNLDSSEAADSDEDSRKDLSEIVIDADLSRPKVAEVSNPSLKETKSNSSSSERLHKLAQSFSNDSKSNEASSNITFNSAVDLNSKTSTVSTENDYRSNNITRDQNLNASSIPDTSNLEKNDIRRSQERNGDIPYESKRVELTQQIEDILNFAQSLTNEHTVVVKTERQFFNQGITRRSIEQKQEIENLQKPSVARRDSKTVKNQEIESLKNSISVNSSIPNTERVSSFAKESKSETEQKILNRTSSGEVIQLSLDPVERISDSELLKLQDNQCASCSSRIYSNFFINFFRYCTYTGKLYCMDCHLNEYSIIPAFVLKYLDSREYPVCSNAKTFLDTMINVPFLSISFFPLEQVTDNPIFTKLRTLRKQFAKMNEFLYSCKKKDKMLEVLGIRCYLLEDGDNFTLRDYTLCLSENKGSFLLKLFNVLDLHIRVDCSQCKSRGSICEFCKDKNLIYPHQIGEVVTCRRCNGVYHTQCYDKKKCPKCVQLDLKSFSGIRR